MKLHKLKIEEEFSTEGLISALSEIQVREEPIEVEIDVEFKDAVVSVKGVLKGYFHEQKMSHDTPQYSDMYAVDVEFDIVKVNYNVEYFEKRVRSLMLN